MANSFAPRAGPTLEGRVSGQSRSVVGEELVVMSRRWAFYGLAL